MTTLASGMTSKAKGPKGIFMRKLAIATAIGAAMALSACGSDETSGTFETDDGEGSYTVNQDGDDINIEATSDEGDFSLQTGDDLDVDLPAGFTIYPGAEVTSNMTMGQENGGGGSVVSMTSDASPEDLLAHYRAEAEAAGIEIKAEMDLGGMKVLAGESGNGASFTVRAGEDGGVTLMVGQESD